MEIIDFHTHLVYLERFYPVVRELFQAINPEMLARLDELRDPQAAVDYLKNEGIRYAVVLPECAPAITGYLSSEDVIDYCRNQDMLIPFASLNPNTDPEPAKKLETYVREQGVKGVKLLPSFNYFYINEARLYPIYAKAEELNIPVMFHIGSSIFKGTRLKCCDPIQLDDVAVDFPDLKIIMAHSGRGFWYHKCFFLSCFHKNIYMDITGLPPGELLNHFPELDKNGDKVIYGTDWPSMRGNYRKNLEEIKSLPLSDKTMEGLLYKNAERVLFG